MPISDIESNKWIYILPFWHIWVDLVIFVFNGHQYSKPIVIVYSAFKTSAFDKYYLEQIHADNLAS